MHLKGGYQHTFSAHCDQSALDRSDRSLHHKVLAYQAKKCDRTLIKISSAGIDRSNSENHAKFDRSQIKRRR
jgi:hypothetical protein